MVCGLWTVDCGLRTVDCGLWTVDCGLWTVDCFMHYCQECRSRQGNLSGRRLGAHINCATPKASPNSPQSTVHSPQSTVHSPQSTVHSPQSTVHSPQTTQSGFYQFAFDLFDFTPEVLALFQFCLDSLDGMNHCGMVSGESLGDAGGG